MDDQPIVISRKVGNFSTGEERADNGRMGRGENAFIPKRRSDEEEIQARIDKIVMRTRMFEENGTVEHRIVFISLPARATKVG